MRILIIRTDRIGDMVLTLPMATAIKSERPTDTVILLGRTYTETIIRLCPDVDEIALYDEDSSLKQFVSQLRSLRADAVIIPSPKPRLAMAAMLAGIPIRIGTGYRWYSFCFTKKIFEHRKTAEFNEAEYNLRMLKALGIDADEKVLATLHIDALPTPNRLPQYIVLHTTTGGSAPAWSTDKWVELSEKLYTVHHLPIVLTGNESESEFLFILSERMKHLGVDVHIHSGGSLNDLIRLLSEANLIVSGSTGPGHLAAALGASTIGLFPLKTVLSKERWGFRGKKAINLAPQQPARPQCPDCAACNCIETISVQDVLTAAEPFLNQNNE